MSARASSSAASAASASASGARTWGFTHSAASHASAQFCPDCQSILDLPDADLILRCPVCTFQLRFQPADARYEKLSVSGKYAAGSAGDMGDEGDAPMVAAFTRAKVKERCPQCANPEMSFYTMQMRSVDEGQTVFYECPKCGHTFSTNT